jgi:hypothetical protein
VSKHLTFSLPLPDHVLKLIDPQERRKLGKGFETMPEIQQRVEVDNERKLHRQIENLLRLKNVVFFHSRIDKKTTRPKGEPDFLFSVFLDKPNKVDPLNVTLIPVPVAWEVKVGNLKLRPEQEEMLRRMQTPPNSWRVKVIRSLQEAADELKALGV